MEDDYDGCIGCGTLIPSEAFGPIDGQGYCDNCRAEFEARQDEDEG